MRRLVLAAVFVCLHSNLTTQSIEDSNLRKNNLFEKLTNDFIVKRNVDPNVEIHENLPVKRIIRASGTGDFHSKADRMAMIGRVLTGISLQNGLIDGSIPGDEAIAEMLNIESVKLEELEKFDKAKVDTFVKNLKDVSSKLDDTSAKLENDIIDMSEIKEEYAKVGDLSKLPADTDFKAIKALDSLDLTLLKDESIISKVTTAISEIPNLPDDTSTRANNGKATVSIQALDDTLTEFQKLLGAVNTIKGSIDVAKLDSVFDNVASLKTFADAMKITDLAPLQGIAFLDNPMKDALKGNLAHIAKVASTESHGLGVLTAFVTSRFHSQSSQRKHTSGLVNGILDLNMLDKDSVDTWVLETLNTSMPIGKGLQPVMRLKVPLTDLNTKWQAVLDWEAYRSLQEADRIKQLVQGSSAKAELVDTVIPPFKACLPSMFRDVSVEPKIRALTNNFAQLKAKIKALAAVISLTTDEKTQKVGKMKATATDDPNSKDMAATVANLKKLNTHKELVDWLGEMSNHLKLIREPPLLSNIIAEIEQRKSFAIQFNTKTEIRGYKAFFDCLKDITVEIEPIQRASNIFKEVRDLKTNTDIYDNINKVSKLIHDSTKDLRAIRSVPSSMKKNQSAEVKELAKFHLSKDAKAFGDAVAGVVAIQKALEKKSAFEVLVKSGQSMDGLIESIVDVLIKEDVKKAWGDSGVMKSSMEKLLTELDQAGTSNRQKRQASDLSSFGAFTSGLTGMTDVNLNADKKLKALEALVSASPSSKTAVEPVQNALKEVSQLNLQFSGHSGSLKDLPAVIDSIGSIFATVQPTTLKNRNNGGGGGSAAASAAGPTVVQTGGVSYMAFYLTIGCLVLAFFVIGIIVWCVVDKNHKKALAALENERKKTEEKNEAKLKELEKAVETAESGKAEAKKARENEAKKVQVLEGEKQQLQNEIDGVNKKIDEARHAERAALQEEQRQKRVKMNDISNKLIKAQDNLNESTVNENNANTNMANTAYDKKTYEKEAKKKARVYEVAMKKQKKRKFLPTFGKTNTKHDIVVNVRNVPGAIPYNFYTIKCRYPTLTENATYQSENRLNEMYLAKCKLNLNWEKVSGEGCRNSHIAVWSKNQVLVRKKQNIFASRVTYPTYGSAIITQLPLNNQCEAFWQMVVDEQSTCMVFFDHEGNNEKNFPNENNETRNYGKFEVRVAYRSDKIANNMIERKLEITDKEGQCHATTLYEIISWPGSNVSTDEKLWVTIWQASRATRRRNSPTIVYDKDGSSKAGAFVAAEMYCQYFLRDGCGMMELLEFMQEINKIRGNMFIQGDFIMFIPLIAIYILCRDEGIPLSQEFKDQMTILAHFYESNYVTKFNGDIQGRAGELADIPLTENPPVNKTCAKSTMTMQLDKTVDTTGA